MHPLFSQTHEPKSKLCYFCVHFDPTTSTTIDPCWGNKSNCFAKVHNHLKLAHCQSKKCKDDAIGKIWRFRIKNRMIELTNVDFQTIGLDGKYITRRHDKLTFDSKAEPGHVYYYKTDWYICMSYNGAKLRYHSLKSICELNSLDYEKINKYLFDKFDAHLAIHPTSTKYWNTIRTYIDTISYHKHEPTKRSTTPALTTSVTSRFANVPIHSAYEDDADCKTIIDDVNETVITIDSSTSESKSESDIEKDAKFVPTKVKHHKYKYRSRPKPKAPSYEEVVGAYQSDPAFEDETSCCLTSDAYSEIKRVTFT